LSSACLSSTRHTSSGGSAWRESLALRIQPAHPSSCRSADNLALISYPQCRDIADVAYWIFGEKRIFWYAAFTGLALVSLRL